jgi:26S proteasome regulatory subunit N11
MDAQLRQMLGQLGGGGGAPAPGGDQPTNDNAETIHISSLALLKVSRSLLCTIEISAILSL